MAPLALNMQDPRNEIADVVYCLATTCSPNVQLKTLNQYFVSDAAFNHPFCKVSSGPNSRERIAKIYQWYSIMSPTISLRIKDIAMGEGGGVICLHMEQIFHIFLLPMSSHPAQFVTKINIKLDPNDSLYRITRQEDWYQPEDLAYLLIPFLSHPILWFKLFATFFCDLAVWVFHQTLGWWAPTGNLHTSRGDEVERGRRRRP